MVYRFVTSEQILANQESWNFQAERFYGATALPYWGLFGFGPNNPEILGDIKDQVFLEVACGSGHSVDYLLKNGARKVYAIDFSEKQIEYARELNFDATEAGDAVFYHSPMENPIEVPEAVDIVFSVYGIGWTLEPHKTFSNIYSYLKPGGKFIWSWDHSLHPRVRVNENSLTIVGSYFDEEIKAVPGWGTEQGANLATRKISSWFRLMRNAGFEILDFIEPEPVNFNEKDMDPTRYYSKQKGEIVPASMVWVCKRP